MSGFFSIPSFLSDLGNPDANMQGLATAAISLGCECRGSTDPLPRFRDNWILPLGVAWRQVRTQVAPVRRRDRRLCGCLDASVCYLPVEVLWVRSFILIATYYYSHACSARVISGIGAAFPLTLGSTREFLHGNGPQARAQSFRRFVRGRTSSSRS